MSKKNTVAQAHLENWYVVRGWGGTRQLIGRIYDDGLKRFPDGRLVRTSDVRTLDRNNRLAWTLNTCYSLGEEKKP